LLRSLSVCWLSIFLPASHPLFPCRGESLKIRVPIFFLEARLNSSSVLGILLILVPFLALEPLRLFYDGGFPSTVPTRRPPFTWLYFRFHFPWLSLRMRCAPKSAARSPLFCPCHPFPLPFKLSCPRLTCRQCFSKVTVFETLFTSSRSLQESRRPRPSQRWWALI